MYFPMFMDITHKPVLLYGSGAHLSEKLRRLLPFRPNITVITDDTDFTAPDTCVTVRYGTCTEDDLSPRPVFVILCHCDEENRRVANLCRSRHIPVNTVDYPPLCDFYFPALIARAPVSVGICSAGVSPTASAVLKEHISRSLPDALGAITDEMPRMKAYLYSHWENRKLANEKLRTAFVLSMEKNRPLTEEELNLL